VNCSKVLKDKLEHQASLFASELILTDKMLNEALPYIQGFSKEQIAAYFNVPSFVTDYKLSQIGSFSNRIYSHEISAFG
ncbi:metallopeptidase ImmA, partial [Escherichia coli]|nr:metallopeptidase ImmA [Escherichia coli]